MADLDNLVQRYYTLQYTGSNSADILEAFQTIWNAADIQSEGGGVLEIQTYAPPGVVTINTDDHIVFQASASGDQVQAWLSPADVSAQFIQVEPLSPTPDQSAGVATIPSLIGNAQTTVSVTLNPAFPDTSYSVASVISGGASLLASLSILSTTKTSGSQVDVVVKNTGLLTLAGASLLVIAVAP